MSWINRWESRMRGISESDLIAYHLHELTPRRELRVARALAASAQLAADSQAIAAMLQALKDTPQPIEQAAFTRVWEGLAPGLVVHAKPVVLRPRWHTPMLAGTAITAILAGLVVAKTKHRLAEQKPASQAHLLDATRKDLHEGPGNRRAVPRDAGKPDTLDAGRLSALPATGFHATLKTGLYRMKPHSEEAPPVHLLALAPLPDRPDKAADEAVRLPGIPVAMLTLEPAPQQEAILAAPALPGLEHKPRKQAKAHSPHRLDVMLGVGGTFIAPHTSLTAGTELRTQTATHAIVAVGAVHQQIGPRLGYRLTLSYTRPEFKYTSQSAEGGINSRIYEVAGTYVVQGPKRGRLSTALDGGGALLAFLPDRSNPQVSYGYRGAGVLEASAEYAVSKHWAVDAGYRAQIFRSPNFRYNGGLIPVTTSVVVDNEPSFGIVYRLGKMDASAER